MNEKDTCDKELLELAAKAAGFTLEEHYDDDQYYPWCAETEAFWNPLLDDGDALRLAVKLGLFIRTDGPYLLAVTPRYVNNKLYELYEPRGEDPYASTRRTIVRAAAEIGKEMK